MNCSSNNSTPPTTSASLHGQWLLPAGSLYIETSDAQHQFAVTSAHGSCLGTTYCLLGRRPGLVVTDIGMCTYCFIGNGLDVALVQLCDDVPQEWLVNTVELLYLGRPRKYMLEIWRESLMALATRRQPVLMHCSRGVMIGTLTTLRMKTSDDLLKKYIAFIAEQNQAGTIQSGDGGCLVTSVAGQDPYVQAYGVVSGLHEINARQYCIISPLWPALE